MDGSNDQYNNNKNESTDKLRCKTAINGGTRLTPTKIRMLEHTARVKKLELMQLEELTKVNINIMKKSSCKTEIKRCHRGNYTSQPTPR